MKARRWEKAAPDAKANPTPLLPIPTNYDIKLRVDRERLMAFCGPLMRRNPPSQVAYDNAVVQWRQGRPQDVVVTDLTKEISYKYPSHGVWKFQIDWRKGTEVLATTKYDLTI